MVPRYLCCLYEGFKSLKKELISKDISPIKGPDKFMVHPIVERIE